MFDKLRKKLKEGVQKLSMKDDEAQAITEEKVPEVEERPPEPEKKEIVKKTEEEPLEKTVTEKLPEDEPGRGEVPGEKPKVAEETPEEPHEERPAPEPAPKPPEPREDRGRLGRFRERVATRELEEKDIDDFFEDGEIELLQSDVALEVADSLREKLKEKLVTSKVKRRKTSDAVTQAFNESLLEIVDQGDVHLLKKAEQARKDGKPLMVVFLGFNGSGKTTSIAKCASFLKKKGFRTVLAAGDSFRAAAIEQLEVHGERLGIKVIKHQYGSDSAAVIFDARKYAEENRLDVVLADTAGRAHTDRNLMDELKKLVRVNNPELKVLVVDSLTGNDAVEQARVFHEAVGVDCIVMTKTDVNPRGGSILSVVHTIRKPVLFLGTGQEYSNIEMFDPRKFVKQLME